MLTHKKPTIFGQFTSVAAMANPVAPTHPTCVLTEFLKKPWQQLNGVDKRLQELSTDPLGSRERQGQSRP